MVFYSEKISGGHEFFLLQSMRLYAKSLGRE